MTREQAAALKPLQVELQTEHDNFLMASERQRQFRQEAKAVTEPGRAMQFNTAADNKSWRDAVLKAARQEAERA